MKNISEIIENLNIFRILNVLGYFLNRILKPKVSLSQPISVDIEPTIFCNLKCEFCHNSELEREKKNMTILEFKRILDNFPYAIKVNIQGMGEPLINQDVIEMIKYAKEQKKFVTMTTNGTLLSEEKARELADLKLDRLIISLDSTDKNLYEKIRKGASFEEVTKNISNFMKIRGNNKKPEIVIWMLGLKETIKGLLSMIDLVKELGADKLVLQSNITSWGKERWFSKAKDLEVEKEDRETLRIIEEGKKKAVKENLKFIVNNKYTIFKKDKDEKCNWPWGGAYIATDGSVVPCCLIADPEVVRLGNVLNEDFKNIWNNKNYRMLRDNIKNNNIPFYCKKCYLNK